MQEVLSPQSPKSCGASENQRRARLWILARAKQFSIAVPCWLHSFYVFSLRLRVLQCLVCFFPLLWVWCTEPFRLLLYGACLVFGWSLLFNIADNSFASSFKKNNHVSFISWIIFTFLYYIIFNNYLN